MSKITERLEKLMLFSVGINLLDILVGILFLVFTKLAIQSNTVILGALILVHGIFFIIRYIYDGLGKKVFGADVIAGTAACILGLFTIFSPFKALNVIGVLFGIWLIIVGLEKVYYVVLLVKNQEGIYPLILSMTILIFIMGVISIFNPFSTFMLITRLIGLFLICTGLFNSMACTLFKKRAKYILSMFK